MNRTKLLLLGSPQIERDGRRIEVDTRKAVALLAYLTRTARSHSRNALATLLWPDGSHSNARAALRRTLWSLNKALDGAGLVLAGDTVALEDDAVWIDVKEMYAHLAATREHGHAPDDVCAACTAPLTTGLALYRDDFLAGFTLRDSATFDDWQVAEAEHIRRDVAHALQRLVRCHVQQHQWDQAIGNGRRWLALDPLNEAAHRALMEIHAWAGQRAAALRQYQKCADLLDQEIGVPPQAETTQLFESIKRGQLVAISHQPSAAVDQSATNHKPQSASQPPLVGRDRAWATLLAQYDAAHTAGRVVVLEGEAGIGKTRLAEALLRYAHAHGAPTIHMRCYGGETNLAYGPFVEGLRAVLPLLDHGDHRAAMWLSEAARLVPDLQRQYPDLPLAPPQDHPGAQQRLFDGVMSVLLLPATRATPLVLCIDDLHWADEASLDLLTYVLRRLRDRPVCFVGTWRSEDVGPTHRLRALLGELTRTGTATSIGLTRLRHDDIAALVQATPLTLPVADVAEQLYRETEGLPLFVAEYLQSLQEQPPQAGGWALPGGVRDLLHSRLRAVAEADKPVLATAAVIGRSFDVATLCAASDRDEDEVIAVLERLLAHGLITELSTGSDGALVYDFSHEKLRTVVYDDTSQARRRQLHRRVADALRVRAPAGALAGQAAQHYRLAGDHAQAAISFKQAGGYARAVYANTEARAHFEAALALGHPDRATLHEALGDVNTLLGDYGAALASYAQALNDAVPATRATLHHKHGKVHARRGAWRLAQQHLETALAAHGDDGAPETRARIVADLSLAAHMAGDNAAQALAQQALALAEHAGDRRARAQAHNMLGMLAGNNGNIAQAQHHLEASAALAEQESDPGAQAAALNNLALAYGAHGEFERAIHLAKQALALSAAQGDRHHEAALHNNLADLHHAAGRAAEALAHVKQAVAIYAEIGVEAGTVQPGIWKLAEW